VIIPAKLHALAERWATAAPTGWNHPAYRTARLRSPWRSVAICLAALSAIPLAARPLAAQQLRLYDDWDDRPASVVTVGFGLNAGIAGFSYMRFLRVLPIGLGVGAGWFGVAPRVEVTLPRLHVHRAWVDETNVRESYLSLGVLAVPFRRTTDLARPALLIEGGRRFWDRTPSRRRGLYSDFGAGVAIRPWGAEGDRPVVPMIRVQMGVSF